MVSYLCWYTIATAPMQHIMKNTFSLSDWNITIYNNKSHSLSCYTILSFYLEATSGIIYCAVTLGNLPFIRCDLNLAETKKLESF